MLERRACRRHVLASLLEFAIRRCPPLFRLRSLGLEVLRFSLNSGPLTRERANVFRELLQAGLGIAHEVTVLRKTLSHLSLIG